jgi:hypothetical protein
MLALYVISMLGMHGVIVWELRSRVFAGFGDFASFYTAGTIVAQGQAEKLYDAAEQWSVQRRFAPEVSIRQGPLPYVRPPFYAIIFVPLAYLPYRYAVALWTLLNFLLLVLYPFLVPYAKLERPFLSPKLFGLACLSLFPITNGLIIGQDAILLLVLMTLALSFFLSGDEIACGVFFACGLFKFHLVVPLALVLFFYRRYRAIASFAITSASLIGISIALVGWQGLLAYPYHVWTLDQKIGAGVTKWQNMPNLRAIFEATTGSFHGLPWLMATLTVVGIGVVFAISRRDVFEDRLRANFSLMIVVILLTSYYAGSYDLTLLLIPIPLFTGLMLRGTTNDGIPIPRWSRVAFFFSTGVFMFTSAQWWFTLTDRYYLMGLAILLSMGVSLVGVARSHAARDYATR